MQFLLPLGHSLRRVAYADVDKGYISQSCSFAGSYDTAHYAAAAVAATARAGDSLSLPLQLPLPPPPQAHMPLAKRPATAVPVATAAAVSTPASAAAVAAVFGASSALAIHAFLEPKSLLNARAVNREWRARCGWDCTWASLCAAR
jgi:hypothetical protein